MAGEKITYVPPEAEDTAPSFVTRYAREMSYDPRVQKVEIITEKVPGETVTKYKARIHDGRGLNGYFDKDLRV